jgi:hypothetical protein
MVSRERRPYGTWSSPITSATLTQGARRLGRVRVPTFWSSDSLAPVFWVEIRPDENGRSALCCSVPTAPSSSIVSRGGGDGEQVAAVQDCVPSFSVRSRVHEYGGGEFVVLDDRAVVFSNDADHALFFHTVRFQRLRFGDRPLIAFTER